MYVQKYKQTHRQNFKMEPVLQAPLTVWEFLILMMFNIFRNHTNHLAVLMDPI